MTDGFFKLQRRFFTHWLWKEERVMSRAEAFLDLLQLACFMPTKQIVSGCVLDVPRGGMVASERYLCARWEWSRTKLRQYLDVLLAERMIEMKKDQGNTILILCNYGHWNSQPEEKKPLEDHSKTSGRPNHKKEEKGENYVTHTSDRATLAEVIGYARSAPVPMSADCAIAFHDEMEAAGWLRKGQPVHDWRAALRRWASHWNQHSLARRQNQEARPSRHKPHPHRQEKSRREFPEHRTTTLPSA
ncbi:hypothetical protein [Luteolibacter sp. LG18]|uniref:hypothetical protein n=1 Tax=Luteolibacter sp. LG18 TaxID=2819286 RepID=UPI0030C6B974